MTAPNKRQRLQGKLTRAEMNRDDLLQWVARCREKGHCHRGLDHPLLPRKRSKPRRTSSSSQPCLTTRAHPQELKKIDSFDTSHLYHPLFWRIQTNPPLCFLSSTSDTIIKNQVSKTSQLKLSLKLYMQYQSGTFKRHDFSLYLSLMEVTLNPAMQ